MYQVTLQHPARAQVSFYCKADETVMAGARRAGYGLAAACEQGGCGACQAVCDSGTVRYPKPASQRRRLGPDGVVYELPCRAVPASDLSLRCVQPWQRIARAPLSARVCAAAHNSEAGG